jgi:hypothetical protein
MSDCTICEIDGAASKLMSDGPVAESVTIPDGILTECFRGGRRGGRRGGYRRGWRRWGRPYYGYGYYPYWYSSAYYWPTYYDYPYVSQQPVLKQVVSPSSQFLDGTTLAVAVIALGAAVMALRK